MKKCLFCEKEIPVKSRREKYCSDRCANTHRNHRNNPLVVHADRSCIHCGKQFTPTHYLSKFCNAEKCLNDRKQKQDEKLESSRRLGKVATKEIRNTKCPRCERIYKKIFIPAWIGRGIPRMQCDACKATSYNIQSAIWGSNEVYNI